MESQKLFDQALAIIDDNIGVTEDYILTNRFSTAHKIVAFAQDYSKKFIAEQSDPKG